MVSRQHALLRLALLAAAGLAAAAPAAGQYITTDPYRPFSDQYQAYAFPIYPNNPALPNQGRLTNSSPYNSFQLYLNSPESYYDRSGIRGGDQGLPYYSAYRKYDDLYQRRYVPNAGIDKDYYRDRRAREQAYFDALREPDAKRRAQLLRDVDRRNSQATRGIYSKEPASAATPRRAAAAPATPPRTTGNRAGTPAGASGRSTASPTTSPLRTTVPPVRRPVTTRGRTTTGSATTGEPATSTDRTPR